MVSALPAEARGRPPLSGVGPAGFSFSAFDDGGSVPAFAERGGGARPAAQKPPPTAAADGAPVAETLAPGTPRATGVLSVSTRKY